jgi:Protein of unknown function (DUF998)
MSTVVGTHGSASGAQCDPATRVTRSLLGYGVLAGPCYVVMVLGQAAVRPGFDLTRDDASLLSNGRLGWVQVANFVVTGLMIIAFAVGIRRALGPGAIWAPRLIGLYGLGLIAAGLFIADPMNGFPPGTPAGRPAEISLHGMLHLFGAAIGFLGLIAACFVLARHFSRMRRRGLAIVSRVTGAIFLLGFAGLASGSGSPAVVAGFWVSLLAVWGWLALLGVHLYRRATPSA